MAHSSAPPTLTSIAPFFIVRDVPSAIEFYRERLGFRAALVAPDDDPFFAILRRDGVQIMIKAILPQILPLPNSTRHPWARWDAFIHTEDPDAMAAELGARGVSLRTPLGNTDESLRGFEIQDLDGYVLFFGRPV